jgi:hypothetical protein
MHLRVFKINLLDSFKPFWKEEEVEMHTISSTLKFESCSNEFYYGMYYTNIILYILTH